MVFHRSLHISASLLTILADRNHAVVWTIFTRAFISNSFRFFTNPLVTVKSTLIIIGITVTFMFNSFFSCLARPIYCLFFFLISFSFDLWSAGMAKSSIKQVLYFFFSVDCHKVWSSGRVSEIRLYHKILKKFERLIFLVVHISFVPMVKFIFLAQWIWD